MIRVVLAVKQDSVTGRTLRAHLLRSQERLSEEVTFKLKLNDRKELPVPRAGTQRRGCSALRRARHREEATGAGEERGEGTL